IGYGVSSTAVVVLVKPLSGGSLTLRTLIVSTFGFGSVFLSFAFAVLPSSVTWKLMVLRLLPLRSEPPVNVRPGVALSWAAVTVMVAPAVCWAPARESTPVDGTISVTDLKLSPWALNGGLSLGSKKPKSATLNLYAAVGSSGIENDLLVPCGASLS